MGRRGKALAFGLLLVSGGLTFGRRHLADRREIALDLTRVPRVICGLAGRDVKSEGLTRYFDEGEYINRVYTDGGARTVYFHMAKPKSPASGQHYPESCVKGAGDRIVEKANAELELASTPVEAQRVITAAGSLIYFWFSNGRRTWTERSLGVWLALALDSEWQSVKYMASTQIRGGRMEEADALLKEFLREIPGECIVTGDGRP